VEPFQRLTLTLPVINSAKRVYFIVSGANKAEPFRRAAQRIINTDDCPACGVHPQGGEPEWWVDKDASGSLFRPGENN
jgi:6-phosphogluconolactonase